MIGKRICTTVAETDKNVNHWPRPIISVIYRTILFHSLVKATFFKLKEGEINKLCPMMGTLALMIVQNLSLC